MMHFLLHLSPARDGLQLTSGYCAGDIILALLSLFMACDLLERDYATQSVSLPILSGSSENELGSYSISLYQFLQQQYLLTFTRTCLMRNPTLSEIHTGAGRWTTGLFLAASSCRASMTLRGAEDPGVPCGGRPDPGSGETRRQAAGASRRERRRRPGRGQQQRREI